MNKRILSVVMSALLVVVAILFLQNEKVVEAADNLVLLEKRHPGYWEYLSPNHMFEVIHSLTLDAISESELKANNVLNKNTIEGTVINGITTEYKDGEFLVSGCATEYSYPGLTKDWIRLDTGTYFISMGRLGAIKDVPVLLKAFVDGKFVDDIADLNETQIFSVDGSQYDTYKIEIQIQQDQEVDLHLHPLIYRISDSMNFVPAEWNSIALWDITGASIFKKDDAIFENAIRHLSGYEYAGMFDGVNCKLYSYKTHEWNTATIDIDEYGKANFYLK